jgi:formylglycine-generating enzyme required for sulfatase activity
MRWVPGGMFLMGSDRHYPEERPARTVRVRGFWMDVHPVTNAEFAAFVKATGYVTTAEQPVAPQLRPHVVLGSGSPGSFVFRQTAEPVDVAAAEGWWKWTPGASWRHPEGPGSSIANRAEHPVVHVTFEDARAYATWVRKVLPTEAEWEYAARGGLDGAEFAWGSEFTPDGRFMANTWQGEFPWQNLCSDGHDGTSPVTSFPANRYGLYDLIGNVWEWTNDWFSRDHNVGDHPLSSVRDDAVGGPMEASYDPALAPPPIYRKVIKGGSFLCAPNYSGRYRPAARQAQMIDIGQSDLGFRCVVHTRDVGTTVSQDTNRTAWGER